MEYMRGSQIDWTIHRRRWGRRPPNMIGRRLTATASRRPTADRRPPAADRVNHWTTAIFNASPIFNALGPFSTVFWEPRCVTDDPSEMTTSAKTRQRWNALKMGVVHVNNFSRRAA